MSARQAGKRQTSKNEILDAAIEVVSELGTGSLTIDAVAEKSGFSKGGVLYNFATKDALMEGMIQLLSERYGEEVERRRRDHQDSESPTLSAMIEVAECWLPEKNSISRAVLISHVNSPGFCEPFLKLKHALKEQIRAEVKDLAKALAIWASLEGLHFSAAHGLMSYSPEEQRAIFAELRSRLSASA